MAPVADFEAFHQDRALYTPDEFQQHLQERFPLEKDRMDYNYWALIKRVRESKKAGTFNPITLQPPLPQKLLLDLLERTDYNNPAVHFDVAWKLSISREPIPVGKDENGDFYRIIPDPSALLADVQDPVTNHELVRQEFLGVDFNAQPPGRDHRQTARLPEKSAFSNNNKKNNDSSKDGFVFFQLGRVEVLFVEEEDEEVESLEDAWEGDWMDTRFCAALRITNDGAADGVYLFYDFYCPDDMTGYRFPKRLGEFWGYLGEGTRQFSCARIANRLSDLKLFDPLLLTEVFDRPLELSRAVQTPKGTMTWA